VSPSQNNLSEAAEHARELATSLEAAVPLCTTRIEHVRVAGHAYQARVLANALSEALETASKPLGPQTTGIRPLEASYGL
jgi:hypothetical protein